MNNNRQQHSGPLPLSAQGQMMYNGPKLWITPVAAASFAIPTVGFYSNVDAEFSEPSKLREGQVIGNGLGNVAQPLHHVHSPPSNQMYLSDRFSLRCLKCIHRGMESLLALDAESVEHERD
ncbi:hypothetical protein PMIN02_013063 [Paraphaeosphaeria minitans]